MISFARGDTRVLVTQGFVLSGFFSTHFTIFTLKNIELVHYSTSEEKLLNFNFKIVQNNSVISLHFNTFKHKV